MIQQILSELESSERPVAKALHKSPHGKCICIGLNTGMEIKAHKAHIPTTILVLKGRITYVQDNQRKVLSTYDQHPIPVDVLHSVECVEDALILLMQL